MTPLLSWGNRQTGFWTWSANGTDVGVHEALALRQLK